ncbi:probable RNA-directed DNA polymerase from transposon BS [Trichonephila clavipes]|nr:probable RNA-directed DNA polymerase from transposon BS [Trichonephila clavipes]
MEDRTIARKARRLVHRCRNSLVGFPLFMEKFQIAELNNAIKTFDFTTSPGPDSIFGLMIVGLSNTAKLFLLNLFNQSWALGKLPLEWKRAIVVPILKPGKEADNPENFRPISLAYIPCKIMERIILDRLNFYLVQNNLFPRDAQNNKPTNHSIAVLLDLTKAFGRVWCYKLAGKLYDEFGVTGCALPWISDFLRRRQFRVKYNNTLSRGFRHSQVVPKGSVLSPILFALFITGIEKEISEVLKSVSLRIVLLFGNLLSAARIITCLSNCCPGEIVLYEVNLQPLIMRWTSSSSKYYSKLYSYGEQHRTSTYLKNWTKVQRLKRDSPFSRRDKLNLPFSDVEPCLLETNSKSSIQYLSNWRNIGDRIRLNIIDNVKTYSTHNDIHLLWIPSHVELYFNDIADELAKEGSNDPIDSSDLLTCNGIYSKDFPHKISLRWIPARCDIVGNEHADFFAMKRILVIQKPSRISNLNFLRLSTNMAFKYDFKMEAEDVSKDSNWAILYENPSWVPGSLKKSGCNSL